MTNLQAIDLLKGLEQSLDDYCELNDEGKTAFGMAITALELFGNSEQLPSAQPKKRTEKRTETHACDLIDRQAAIDDLHGKDPSQIWDTADIEVWLNALPPAQPESTRTFVELVVEYPDLELCTYKEYKGKPYYSIKYIENGETHVGYGTYKPEVLSQFLKEYFMPSAQPERPKGAWNMIQGNIVVCSECGMGAPQVMTGCLLNRHLEPNRTNFCPNCGADLRGETKPYNVNVEGK